MISLSKNSIERYQMAEVKKGAAKIATCISLTPECKKMLKSAAKKKGISQAAVVEMAVRDIVRKWGMPQ